MYRHFPRTARTETLLFDRFSLIWLAVMTLFPIAVLLLKFNRGRLPREPRTSLGVVFITLAVAFVVIGGNIAIDPSIVG